MTTAEEEDTVAAELGRFYSENDFGPGGGQESSSVKIQLNRWCAIYIPNFSGRKKALLKHDIHHLVTGYSSGSIIGESEISAWEIASGCKTYRGAFLLNTSGAMFGILIDGKRIFKAFVKGRRSKSLYHNFISLEQAMDMRLADLKDILEMTRDENTPTVEDWLLFAGFCIFGLVYSLLLLPLVPFVIGYTVYIRIYG